MRTPGGRPCCSGRPTRRASSSLRGKNAPGVTSGVPTTAESLDARRSAVPYAPLCGERIYLLNPTQGHQTPIEAVTDLLREKVPGGEKIVSFVRDTFFARLYRNKAEEEVESMPVADRPRKKPVEGPAPALVDADAAVLAVKPLDLGIEIEDSVAGGAIPGDWYAAKDIPGVFVSLITPGRIAPEILRSYPLRVNHLGAVESGQLVYLVAFDLAQFDVHYTLGTTHPGVEWSGRVQSRMKEPSLPGPDGIGTCKPFVRTGFINPSDAPHTAAGFCRGIQTLPRRFQGRAARSEESRQPLRLSGGRRAVQHPSAGTFDALRARRRPGRHEDLDGRRQHDSAAAGSDPLCKMASPSSRRLDATGRVSASRPPGQPLGRRQLVGHRGPEAADHARGGRPAGIQGRRFLVYAFFWSATPSAVARVFQAYQCRYAMPLDMNALEHTYLAVYKKQGSNISVQHLIRRMADVDMTGKGSVSPFSRVSGRQGFLLPDAEGNAMRACGALSANLAALVVLLVIPALPLRPRRRSRSRTRPCSNN